MTTITISLPESMKEFIDSEVSQNDYSTVSEYLRDLIRNHQKRKAEDRLEALLLEGLESESSEMTQEDWQEIRRVGLRRLEARKSE